MRGRDLEGRLRPGGLLWERPERQVFGDEEREAYLEQMYEDGWEDWQDSSGDDMWEPVWGAPVWRGLGDGDSRW